MQKKEETLTDLLKFIFMTKDIEGTRLEQFIQMTVKEEAPQIYKPRKGKVNGNMDKFTDVQL